MRKNNLKKGIVFIIISIALIFAIFSIFNRSISDDQNIVGDSSSSESESFGNQGNLMEPVLSDSENKAPSITINSPDSNHLYGNNAPSFNISIIEDKTIFEDNFESDLSKWVSITGLWHKTNSSSSWPNSYYSYKNSMWFGQESTGDYETNSREKGSLTSIFFDLSLITQANLEFYQWREGELHDCSYIYISIDGKSWDLLNKTSKESSSITAWERKIIDISKYCGNHSVQIKFEFDTKDKRHNKHRGWLIDDVKIYDTSFTEPITWYTLDNGIVNTTFTGTEGKIDQTIWDTVENGKVYLKFYAKDALNNIGSAEVIIEKDICTPVIIISSPSQDTLFGTDSPSFKISIIEENLDIMWYTMDDGLTNKTFRETRGTIDQALWDTVGDGDIIIKFFAEDYVNNIGSAQISIKKNTSSPLTNINYTSVYLPNFVSKSTLFSFSTEVNIKIDVDNTLYRVDGGNWIVYSTQFDLESYSEGIHSIEYYSVDITGNKEAIKNESIYLDIDSSTTSMSYTPTSEPNIVNKTTIFTLLMNDGFGSGVNITKYRIDSDNWITYFGRFNLEEFNHGNHTIEYYSVDKVGNMEKIETLNVKLMIDNGENEGDANEGNNAKKSKKTELPKYIVQILSSVGLASVLYFIFKKVICCNN